MFFVCLFVWCIRHFFFQHEQNISLEKKLRTPIALFNSRKRVKDFTNISMAKLWIFSF